MKITEIVKRLRVKCEAAGAEVHLFDYGLTATARFPGEESGIYLVHQYRPERDGRSGMTVVSDECLEAWLSSKS